MHRPSRALARIAATSLTASLLLAGCDTTSPLLQRTTVIAPDAPLPPSPARTWADNSQDVNTFRGGGWGLVSMPAMRVYLNGLYKQIKVLGGHPDWPGEVYVLADPSLKSVSSAAGNIYVSLGWLQSVETEDELFAILSHEYGHIYLGHHVIYDATSAGDTATRLAMVAVALANSKVPVGNLNSIYAIGVVNEVSGSTLVPAWKRSVEEEADFFGATLSLRAGYSYPRGFKVFLERIASYDDAQREAAEKTRVETEKNDRDAAVKSITAQARREQSTQKDVTGLSKGMADAQIKLGESVHDAGAALKRTMANLGGGLRETHGSASEREDRLSAAVAPALSGKPRASARTAPWEAARQEPATAEILAHYALLPQVDDALAKRDYASAVKTATVAASGRTANDALPLYQLGRATVLLRPGASVGDLQRRHLNAAERSWQYEYLQSVQLVKSNRVQGRALLDQQFAYFQKAPVLWPSVIAFYRDNGYLDDARAMAQTCLLQMPAYRAACSESAKTEAERQAEAAASERKAKEIVDKNTPKWMKNK